MEYTLLRSSSYSASLAVAVSFFLMASCGGGGSSAARDTNYTAPDTTAPVWDSAMGICSAQDTGAGGSVVVDFGSATDDVNGADVTYNLYYAPTAVWNAADWGANDVVRDVALSSGSVCANAFTLGGLQSGTGYTFGVRAEDLSGNEDANTSTAAATPTGTAAGSFSDDFSTDSRSEYTVAHTQTVNGVGQFLYDSLGRRLRVLTGDDVALRFSHALPTLASGVFTVDYQPVVKYPLGGQVWIRLRADADNYIELLNSDGYGAGAVTKVVNGQQVDAAAFSGQYSQGNSYRITIRFGPAATVVEAFGKVLVMDTDATAIAVTSMEVELRQQDAYVDNILYTAPDTTAPVWDSAMGICSAQDTGAGGSVVVDFGSATDDVNGTDVTYNLYYAPTAVWNAADWGANDVVRDVALSSGSVCANAFTLGGLQSGTGYTFGVRAEDLSGNEDANTSTATATPTGTAAGSFSDDFITDSRSEYAVAHTQTVNGVGQFLYDSLGRRLRVLTGDDVALRFSHALPTLASGVFTVDYQPVVKYPLGGQVWIRLRADADNYYEVLNSDGYGAGAVTKVVNGQQVDRAVFSNEYSQGGNYTITIRFAPGWVSVEAFGEAVSIVTAPQALGGDQFRDRASDSRMPTSTTFPIRPSAPCRQHGMMISASIRRITTKRRLR